MGDLPGIGEVAETSQEEAEKAMEQPGAVAAVPKLIKRTFAQVLKENSYKAFRQELEEQRKERAIIAEQERQRKEEISLAKQDQLRKKKNYEDAQQHKKQVTTKAPAGASQNLSTPDIVDIESQKEVEVAKQGEESVKKQGVIKSTRHILDHGKDVDWAWESATDQNDPLFKTQLTIKQQIAEDCSLNNSQVDTEYSDGDDDFPPGSKAKRPLSSPPAASPIKISKQTPGQPVEGSSTPGQPVTTEMQIKFLPDEMA